MTDALASVVILMMASVASSMSAGALKIMKDQNAKKATSPPKTTTSKKTTSKPSSGTAKSKTGTSAPAKTTAPSNGGATSSGGWPKWSSQITAGVDTRASEMRDALQNLQAGRRTTKQMTGSDGRIYFVVPNGLEDDQIAWLQELTAFTKKLYSSALSRHGENDVYTARLGTLIQDSKVSYINANSYYAGDSPYTSIYPSGKHPPLGMFAYPFICMGGWWEAVDRRSVGSALMPKDKDWKPKVLPYALHLFMHEIAHAIAGLIGHQEYWVKAWNWVMHEAEAAGLWSHSELVKTLNGTILSKDTFSMDPSRYYSWDPYTDEQLSKCVEWGKSIPERGQQDNVYSFSPYYKKGLGCPCT